ncbi:DNA mismatch repair protein [Microbotryomycetes sp. JL221]|nr:DNA mismatch repair protein [Microbotryomycetes sp. JL221]
MDSTTTTSDGDDAAMSYDYVDAATSTSLDCPICRSPLRPFELVRPPRIIEHMCDELKVYCSNKHKGCQIVIERGLLHRHVTKECTTRQTSVASSLSASKLKGKAVDPAEGPGLELKRSAMPTQDDMDMECSCCGLSVDWDEQDQHRQQCPGPEINCQHCSACMRASQIPSHNLSCPDIVVPCPHAKHGCTARVARARMHDEHLDLTCPYEPIKDYLDSQHSRLVELESDNSMLSARCTNLENDMSDMRQLMSALRSNMGSFFPVLSTNQEQQRTSNLLPPSVATAATGVPPASSTLPAFTSSQQPLSVSPTVGSHLSPRSPQADPFAFLPLDDTIHTASSHSTTTGSDAIINQSSTSSLPSTIASLQQNIANLSATVTSFETRQSTNLVNETIRIQDDVQSLRAIVHGVRMQMHYVMMELNRLTGGGGGNINLNSFTTGTNQFKSNSIGIKRMNSNGSSSDTNSNVSDGEDSNGLIDGGTNHHRLSATSGPSNRWLSSNGPVFQHRMSQYHGQAHPFMTVPPINGVYPPGAAIGGGGGSSIVSGGMFSVGGIKL